jgi:hypothetical protein
VLTETVLAPSSSRAGRLVRAPGAPTAAELSASRRPPCCAPPCVVLALHASLRRPFRAELRGPARRRGPPGALALASLRLALPTAVVGSCSAPPPAPGGGGCRRRWRCRCSGLCGLSGARTARGWADPVHRVVRRPHGRERLNPPDDRDE